MMKDKIDKLQELHKLYLAEAITKVEFEYLKSEIIGEIENVEEEETLTKIVEIPDMNFRRVLTEKYGVKFEGNKVDVKDIKDIGKIKCAMEDISSLEGIQHFTSLYYLDCSFNDLEYLDVSHNKELKELHFVRNQIDVLDLSKNPSLTILAGNYNYLMELDLTNNPCINTVYCSNNEIDSLLLPDNSSLQNVHLAGNPGDWWLKYQTV